MTNHFDESVKLRAIESLANGAKLSFDQVAPVYEHERARLDLDARVKKFLPIFTFRNVQEVLALHRVA